MNSAEDHEAADALPTNTTSCFEDSVPDAVEPVTPPNDTQSANQQSGRSGMLSSQAVSGEEGGVSCLQWIEVLELQVVGACRSDERLRPSLRWNVSCFGSDGRLLVHLGQHFKARELALLARCLCTPMVSLRVGKVSRHGCYLYPSSARGYLNLMLLPCSEMRLVFVDDVGTVERVAVTIPGLESGGLLIDELKEDASQRTFVLKDCCGKITNFFWQSEKIKSIGDELIAKIRTMLKQRPTLADLTGIDEGRLDSFADYLRTAIFSKTSSTLSPPTQFSDFPPNPKLLEFPSKDLLKHSSIESSMEKLRQCMQDIDSSLSPNSPLHMLAQSLPATTQLIESLKRLRQCLHSLTTRRSNIMTDNVSPHVKKGPPFVTLSQSVILKNNTRLTILYRNFGHMWLDRNPRLASLDCNLGSALADQALVNYPSGHCCPTTMRHFRLHKPLVYNHRSFFGLEIFTHVVSQMLAIISHVPYGAAHMHNFNMVLFALEHCGDDSLPHLSPFMGPLQIANLGGCYGTNVLRSLPMHMNHAKTGVIVHDPSARSSLRRLIKDDQVLENGKRKMEKCGTLCRQCTAGTGLGNLVLVNFYVQETWPGLRVVMAEITSGNISYIVVSVAHRYSTPFVYIKTIKYGLYLKYKREECVFYFTFVMEYIQLPLQQPCLFCL